MRNKLILLMFLSSLCAGFAVAEPDDSPVYIDVRSWAEYQVDHIDGDQRIPVADIVAGTLVAYPDKSTEIHVYCAAGGRAGRAADQLRSAGYSNVHNAGGISDVRKARAIE